MANEFDDVDCHKYNEERNNKIESKRHADYEVCEALQRELLVLLNIRAAFVVSWYRR
jgi:hypothetical protein